MSPVTHHLSPITCHPAPTQGWIHWGRSSLEGKSTETTRDPRAKGEPTGEGEGESSSPSPGSLGWGSDPRTRHQILPKTEINPRTPRTHLIPHLPTHSLGSCLVPGEPHQGRHWSSFFFSLFSTSRESKNPVKLLLVIHERFALIPFQECTLSGAQLVHVVKKVGKNMEKAIPVPASTAHTSPEIPPGLFSPLFVSNPHSAAFGTTKNSPPPQTNRGYLPAFSPIQEEFLLRAGLAKEISH